MVQNRTSSCALAIFAKTPYLSPVKTRLAEDIGEEKAIKIYEAMLNCIKTFSQSLPSYITPFFSLAENSALTSDFWKDVSVMHSGHGGLGARLHHTYSTLKTDYDYVILIGSDSPQITPECLKETYEALAHYDYVIGPSFDGGFYLFASRVRLPEKFWLSPTYSCGTTLNQLIEYIDSPIHFLPDAHDLDTFDDIQPIGLFLELSAYSYHQQLFKKMQEVLSEHI